MYIFRVIKNYTIARKQGFTRKGAWWAATQYCEGHYDEADEDFVETVTECDENDFWEYELAHRNDDYRDIELPF